MLKWIRETFQSWNDVQKELNHMGIFHANTLMGSYTHVDKEQFKKYLNEQRTISKDNRQTKV